MTVGLVLVFFHNWGIEIARQAHGNEDLGSLSVDDQDFGGRAGMSSDP